MNRQYRHRKPGFTILELLVAMSITLAMLFLINQLFFDTVRAVGEGAHLGQILAAHQAITDQIRRDAEAMVGPSEGGFLLILNRRVGDWNNNGTLAGDTNLDGFVIQSDGETPSPSGDPEGVAFLQPDGSTDRRYVRSDQLVFFRRAEDLESLTPGTNNAFSNAAKAPYARLWYGHALRTDPDGTGPAVVRLGGGPNALATNWVLGRQALLLAGPDVTGVSNFYVGSNAKHDDPVQGVGTAFYMGHTDVASTTLNVLSALIGSTNEPGYKILAYRYAFPDSIQSVFPFEQRLRVNPIPNGTSFTSNQIAQMHPFWMDNVSDFVVEFAMDTDGTDGVAQPDTHGGTGNLIWYGLSNPPPILNSNSPVTGLPRYGYTIQHFGAPTHPTGDKRYTFRHDYPDYWPYLIRIRYRLHDRLGRFESYVGDSSSKRRESGKWFEQIIAVNRK